MFLFDLQKKLTGKLIDLELIDESHREELRAIAQDKSIWTYVPYSLVGEQFDIGFDKMLSALQSQRQVPFVVRRSTDHKVLGSTRLYDIELEFKRLRLGYTWYISEVRGTQVNPEAKCLLLQYAFENLKVIRVEFCVDSRNLRSRAAIEKLSAVQEGILRQHMTMENGYTRDTMLYSILKQEWPMVKKQLQERLRTSYEKS